MPRAPLAPRAPIMRAGADDAPEATNQVALAARNVGLGLALLLAPEFLLRVPAYGDCVQEKGRDACADLLPLFDALFHAGVPGV